MNRWLRKSFLRDFLLVTLSVSAAFWVEDYREQRRDNLDSKSLLMKISSDIWSSNNYQEFVVEHSRKHVLRFDTLIADLEDCHLDSAQHLVNLHSYMAYMADWTGSASFEALVNSGLASSLGNDTLVAILYTMHMTNRRNMDEYRSGWKGHQQQVEYLIRDALGSKLKLNRQFGILEIQDQSQHIPEEVCQKLKYELLAWQSHMHIFSDILERDIADAKNIMEFLRSEIES